MTNMPASVLQKVEATRAVMSVLKRVQEAQPAASPSQVWRAVKGAVYSKLSKLETKEVLTDTEHKAVLALRVADGLMTTFQSLYGDDETTRALEPEEVAFLTAQAEKRKAAAKASREKRAAAKASKADAGQKAMFAKA